MFAGADDTATVRLNPGRNRHDEISYFAAIRAGRKAIANWPAAPAVLPGAILPQYRIVAYYGNPHSKRMGVLGEYPEKEMRSMLDNTAAMWRKADPSTPVIPAIHLVAVVAQGYAGPDQKWRLCEVQTRSNLRVANPMFTGTPSLLDGVRLVDADAVDPSLTPTSPRKLFENLLAQDGWRSLTL